MTNEYNDTEKIWRGPFVEHNYPNIGIGHLVLEKLKETDPERVLEVENESGASLTAGQIRSQTITVAQNLMRLGVKKGDIVIVYSRSNIKITPITFALYTIGVTVNFFYLDLKGEDIEYYFELMDPTVILYEEEFKTDTFQALTNLKLSNLKHILSLDYKTESLDEILFKPIDNIENFQPPDIGDPNEVPALLNFTSGSTGRPKISVHSHSMMLMGLHNKWWHMEPKSVVCTLSDLRWISQIEIMLQPVFYDVIRIYTSKCNKDFGDSDEYELLYSNKVTHYCNSSIMILKTLQDVDKTNQISKLRHLRVILLGGEVVTKSLLDYAAKIIPHCKIITSYGVTELHGIISSDEKVTDGKIVNGGILANGYELKVIDEHGNHLGPNEKGRLCLRSKVPLIGYFKNDRANKEYFKGDGWYTTEDYGYIDCDHLLNVVIRYKYLLKYNGKFIVPTDIENIVNNHPNVLTSALVGYPDPENIDSELGTIFVVPKNYSQSDGIDEELLVLLRKNLTKDQIKLVRFLKVVEKAPMVNACKVDRVALKERAAIESANYLVI